MTEESSCLLVTDSSPVQVVRYSPDGSLWASGGFDGKIFLYDGKDSEKKGELSGHTGGIYGLAWDGASKKLLSASGDKTCRLWDISTQACLVTFKMGDTVEDQQVGCLWSGPHMISISLSGFINYLDPEKPDKPKKVLKGHNKPVTKMAVSGDGKTIYTSGSDGVVTCWDSESGKCERASGSGHGVQVSGVAVAGNQVLTVGYDDTLRVMDTATCSYTGAAVSLSAQPKAITTKNDMTYVVTMKSIVTIKAGAVLDEMNVEFEPSCCAYSPTHNHLVVGENSGNMVRVYSTQAGGLDLVKEITLTGSAQDLAFSPDQKYLVSADSNRKVTLFNAGVYDKPTNKEWGFHTAKVNCVAWAPNSLYVASGGLDTTVILWSVEAPDKHCILRNAHDQSQITGIAWLDNSSVVSCGQDSNVKVWNVTWPN